MIDSYKQPFPAKIVSKAKEHARSEYPRECCGIIAGDDYHPCENTHENPEEHFKLSIDSFLKVTGEFGEAGAIVHSHSTVPWPSEDDLCQQIASNIPWGIVWVQNGLARDPLWWGDSLPMQPLIGRPFIHGIFDCYALSRDYLRSEHGLTIPNVPRKHAWWNDKDAPNVLLEHIDHLGFDVIGTGSEFRPGDGFLVAVRGSKPNHCGIYIGKELFIHQPVETISRREPINRWVRYITHHLRHRSMQ